MKDPEEESDENEIELLTKDFEPMPTETTENLSPITGDGLHSTNSGSTLSATPAVDRWEGWRTGWGARGRIKFPRYHALVTDGNILKFSMWSLQFSVICSSINTKMLNPNYPLMVSGIHPESFPNTDPLGFNSATYFIPMMSLLGVAISSLFIGRISDRVGRKKPILVMAVVSGFGSIVKYLVRNSFWGFCIANLVFGFFLGNLPIALAYVGDVFTSKKEKQSRIGTLVGNFVLGNAGGGMIAILMQNSGLFSPLWVGAGLMFLSAIVTTFYLIEPGDVRLVPVGSDALIEEEEEADIRPTEINKSVMWNVVGGALFDNFGSTALFPLCLSPLALEQYLFDLVRNNKEPIMSYVGYQWLSVCVALLVIPSTFVTPFLFSKLGCGGTCVLGNICTAVVTLALLLIGNGPQTTAAFAGFVTVLYTGFPTTVWSQLTTGPMLDVLAPEDKIGYVQGLNNSTMNFGMAIAPWLYGLLADATATNTAIGVGIGISVLAAVVNAPLVCRPEMGPLAKRQPPELRILPGEDEELVEKVLHGEIIPAEQLFELNRRRALKKKPAIVGAVKPYDEEKDSLDELRAQAADNFRFRKELQSQVLSELANPESERDASELCEMLNATVSGDPQVIKEHTDALGIWISDYLMDNGYHPHLSSTSIKQMVLLAFPSITRDTEYTPENISQALISREQIFSTYLEGYEKKNFPYGRIFGNGARPQFYS